MSRFGDCAGLKFESCALQSLILDVTSSAGPSVYIPAPDLEAPPEDYKAIDASRLTVHQAAENYVRFLMCNHLMHSCSWAVAFKQL